MQRKESTAQSIMGQLKRIPELIELAPRSPSDLALLAFTFRHRNEQPAPIPRRSRRARAVSAFRKKQKTVTLELGTLSPTSEHNFYRGFSDDVEDGGIFVSTYDIQPIGTTISVSFDILENRRVRRVHARGVVQYTREFASRDASAAQTGMGIRFCYLENRDRSLVEAYQKNRPPIFFDI